MELKSVATKFSFSRQGRLTWRRDTVFGVATRPSWLTLLLPSYDRAGLAGNACTTGHQRARQSVQCAAIECAMRNDSAYNT